MIDKYMEQNTYSSLETSKHIPGNFQPGVIFNGIEERRSSKDSFVRPFIFIDCEPIITISFRRL